MAVQWFLLVLEVVLLDALGKNLSYNPSVGGNNAEFFFFSLNNEYQLSDGLVPATS